MNMTILRRPGWLALSFVVLGCADPPTTAHLALRGVSVVDVETGQVALDRTILIEGDRIAAIGSTAELDIPTSVEVVEGERLFAIPGLVDLHVHMVADDLPLFLANGITTVREMNGSSESLGLRAEVRAGERVGPWIHVAGPLLAGVEQQWRHTLISDGAAARAEVSREGAAGYEFVKAYDGLSAESYRAIIATAAELDLPVLGHIPADVGLDGVIASGQASIEHVEQIAYATVGHSPDSGRIPEIVRRIRDGGIAVTPTLAAQEILSSRRTAWFDGLFERPEMRYTPPDERGWWESLRQAPQSRAALRDGPVGGDNDWLRFLRELTRQLAEAGVPILVGTDTPNPLLVPGFSMQHELEALRRAGLDPARVLRAATLDAAVHLGAEDELGALRSGLRADIVLLGGDPLADMAHLREIRGLVLRGEWHGPERLEAALQEVATRRTP